MNEQIIDMMREQHRDLKDEVQIINDKVDKILEWKWKLVGGTLAVSGGLTLVVQIFVFIFKKS